MSARDKYPALAWHGQRPTCTTLEAEAAAALDELDRLTDENLELRTWKAAADTPRENHMPDDVSPGLLDALRALGDSYGPLGVARVACSLTDPAAVFADIMRSYSVVTAQGQEPPPEPPNAYPDRPPPLATCPSCGSDRLNYVRPPCSLDAYDPHDWHRG